MGEISLEEFSDVPKKRVLVRILVSAPLCQLILTSGIRNVFIVTPFENRSVSHEIIRKFIVHRKMCADLVNDDQIATAILRLSSQPPCNFEIAKKNGRLIELYELVYLR